MTEQRTLQTKYATTKQAAEQAPVKGVFAEAWTGVSVAEGFCRKNSRRTTQSRHLRNSDITTEYYEI